MNTIFETPMYIVYTGGRYNRILIFPTFDDAAAWLRSATRMTEVEIAKAIKTPQYFTQNNYISVKDF